MIGKVGFGGGGLEWFSVKGRKAISLGISLPIKRCLAKGKRRSPYSLIS